MNNTNKYTICFLAIALLILINLSCIDQNKSKQGKEEIETKHKAFEQLTNLEWQKVFFDTCTQNWQDKWFLDGLKAKIVNTENGMDFFAGPTAWDDSCHAVLWTKDSFKGGIKIEYEYTKLDATIRNVTILYIQAAGCGQEPYTVDISDWAELRIVPSMRHYFDNMNTYHISYAAYKMENDNPEEDYIRARRYMPELKQALDGTALEPDYFRTGLFNTDVPHKITIIKKGNDLYMQIKNDEREMLCHWKNHSLPPIIHGRIGLRHMFTRGARYKNFSVWSLE